MPAARRLPSTETAVRPVTRTAPSPGPAADVLRMQRVVGNRAVGTLLRKHGIAVAPETPNSYVDLLNSLDELVTHWQAPGGADLAPPSGRKLIARHRVLLERLREALILVRSDDASALTLWDSIAPGFDAELKRAAAAGLQPGDVSDARAQLAWVRDKVIRPGAYWAEKNRTMAEGRFEAPDLAREKEHFEEAEEELKKAAKLLDETRKLAGEMTTRRLGFEAGAGAEIVDLVLLPGSIAEKLEYARKHGIVGAAATATELTGKIVAATKTTVGLAAEIGKRFYEGRKALALSKGLIEEAETAEKVIAKFSRLGKVLERVGVGASVIALVADGIKLVGALREGDYEAALDVGFDVLTDAAPLALGAEAAGPASVVVIVLKAEIEALKSAAAFVRWCKDEDVRQWASAFIDDCNRLARGGANALVADAELMLVSPHQAVRDIATDKAIAEARQVVRGLDALATRLQDPGPSVIGRHVDVIEALGRPARDALSGGASYLEDPLSVAQRCADVFHGANLMAKYVSEHYRN